MEGYVFQNTYLFYEYNLFFSGNTINIRNLYNIVLHLIHLSNPLKPI